MFYHEELLSCSFLLFLIHFWRELIGMLHLEWAHLGGKEYCGALNSLGLCILIIPALIIVYLPFPSLLFNEKMLETNGKMEYLADFYTCKPITGQSFADRWTPLISATGSGFSLWSWEIFAPWSSRVCRPCLGTFCLPVTFPRIPHTLWAPGSFAGLPRSANPYVLGEGKQSTGCTLNP